MTDEMVPHEEGESGVGEVVLQDAPLVAIAQPASSKKPAEVQEGQYYCPDSGEPLGKKIVFVPVAEFDTRAYFPKDKDPNFVQGNKVPRCSSVDAKFPMSGESPEHADGESVGTCVECAFGRWHKDKADPSGKKRVPPLCSESINFFAVIYDESGGSRIARLRFTRTGYKPAAILLKSFGAQFPPKPMFTTAVEATLAGPFGQERGQKYYEPRLRVLGPTEKWKPGSEAAFRKLAAQWPALHDKIKARVAQGGDEGEAEHELPF